MFENPSGMPNPVQSSISAQSINQILQLQQVNRLLSSRLPVSSPDIRHMSTGKEGAQEDHFFSMYVDTVGLKKEDTSIVEMLCAATFSIFFLSHAID